MGRAIFTLRQICLVGALVLLGNKAIGAGWTPSGLQGLAGANSSRFMIHDRDGRLFVGGSAGIFRSDNGGESWQSLPVPNDQVDPFAMIVHPLSNSIYCAVEDGVYRSIDLGQSWNRLPQDELVGTYATASRADGLLVLAGSAGTFLSMDNGASWNNGAPIPTIITSPAIAITLTGDLFVVTLEGIIRSTDDGLSWQNVTASLQSSNSFATGIASDPRNGILYATVEWIDQQFLANGILYRSADGGDNWTAVDSVTHDIFRQVFVDHLGQIYTARYFPPPLFQPALFLSRDDGRNWEDISSGFPVGEAATFFHEAPGGRVFAGTERDGVFQMTIGPSTTNGDADGDGGVSISDAVYLIAYIFAGGAPPETPALADADGSCDISIGDAVYLISYIFLNGPAPQVGCATFGD